MATRYRYAPLRRGSSADPFALLHEQMDRLFDQTLWRLGLESPARRGSTPAIAPPMDVTETEHELRIELDVPGVAREDLELTLDGDLLAVRGQRRPARRGNEQEQRTAHLSERAQGAFERTLQLPFAAEMDQCSASLQDGVLTIQLDKSAGQRRGRRIEIRAAQDDAPARAPLRQGETEIVDAERPAPAGEQDRQSPVWTERPPTEQRAH